MDYCLIILINLIVFFPTIWYGLVVDDEKRLKATTKSNLLQVLRNSGHSTIDLRLEHGLTVVVHTVVCCLVYKFTGLLVVALLFAIHPTNNQVSVWMNGKRYAVSAGIVLIMAMTMPWGLVLFPLFAVFQISGFFSTILYLQAGYWWAVFMYPLLFAMGGEIIFRQLNNRYKKIKDKGDYKKFNYGKLVIFVKSFGYYTKMCLFPHRVAFLHSYLEGYGGSRKDNERCYRLSWDFWLSLVTLLGIVVFGIVNRSNSIGYGLFWYCLFIAQWCNFPITITQTIAERYCYLPMIGLLIAVVHAIKLIPSPQVQLVLFTILFTGYLIKLLQVMPSYRNIAEFMNHNAYEFPNQHRIYAEMANRYMKKGLHVVAYATALRGLEHSPNDFKLNTMTAHVLILYDKVKYEEVIEYHLKVAKDNVPWGDERGSLRHLDVLRQLRDTNMEEARLKGEEVLHERNISTIN